MNKYKITLSISIIFSIILMIFGSILIVNGIISKININNCKSLELLKVNEFRGGEYVCGNIESLLGKESNFAGGQLLFPLCNTDVWSREKTYVIRINKVESNYICIKVGPKFLASFKNSIGTDLSSNYLLYGKIKKISGYDISIRDSINENKNDSNQIIDDKYLIEVVNFNKEIEKIYQGFIVLVSGFFLLLVYFKIEK